MYPPSSVPVLHLDFSLVDENVASLHVWVGKWVLTVVCAYVQNNSSVFPVLLESLGGVLEGASGDSIVLVGYFNAHMGNNDT